MHLSAAIVTNLNEERLRAFLALSVPEGLHLDYKLALSGGALTKDAKREFLKDVTGFANAAGGVLLIGAREPDPEQSVDDQLVGVEDGETVAQMLERLASSSIDPRIPGLLIVSVPLASGRTVIVVHVPPSLGRPHMVQHEGHRSFYVRHSESTHPMSTHEIREAVLASASAEMRARRFVELRLNEMRGRAAGNGKPAFFLQAMPLITPPDPWDVFDSRIDVVLRSGGTQSRKTRHITLDTSYAPRPTIDGIMAVNQRDDPTWELEVHRTGYLSLLCWHEIVRPIDQRGTERPVLYVGFGDLFVGFAGVLTGVLEAMQTDVPYLLACAYLNAAQTHFCSDPAWGRFTAAYGKPEIVWPEHIRATGTDPQVIAQQMSFELCHAFGLRTPPS
jgi:hypothetical protein